MEMGGTLFKSKYSINSTAARTKRLQAFPSFNFIKLKKQDCVLRILVVYSEKLDLYLIGFICK